MQIVIHAGGIPFDGDTINERSLGGSESAAYYVAKELASRGHKVVVFTEKEGSSESNGVTYLHLGERNQAKPMGTNWHFYCENTPHEVNIIQRVPSGFTYAIQSKINLWWAHDIALKRNNNAFMSQTWQTNAVLPVSNWFKDQIEKAWLVDPDRITPVHNGVDYSLFEQFELKDNSKKSEGITLLYSSRPERGLEHLVRPGGIMERLLEDAPHIKLKVCGYEHPVPQLEGFYGFLRERCEELPNVEHLGQLTKEALCKIQCEEADVWCYPTEFEEVSCITAMEFMAAGATIVTTNIGALPETIGDYENAVIFNADDGVDEDKFVTWLTKFDNKFRRHPKREYTWGRVADEFEEVITNCFYECNKDVDAVARHYLRNSDIVAAKQLCVLDENDPVRKEVEELYDGWMYDQKAYAEHYAEGTEEMYDGPVFAYELPEFINHPRFMEVARWVGENFKDGASIIDYGCAHGHFTNYLAQMFPQIDFLGIDVSPKAIEVAEDKAKEMELSNISFFEEDWLGSNETPWDCDGIILGEILEHVPDPVKFMEVVRIAVGDVKAIVTTPFGPWEKISYESDYPKRFHLHHFERSDIDDMFGHHDSLIVNCLPAGAGIGWYVYTFEFEEGIVSCGPIDYDRKLAETAPQQTVSFCCIVKDGEAELLKLLRSVEPYADEIIIGIDETTTDNTEGVIFQFEDEIHKRHRSPELKIEYFDIPSPVEIGFDAARNLTIEKATKHWIMWADADEEFICGERLPKYLRQNGWKGYGIPQHHFSTEPLGVLSTDYPVRLFRRDQG